MKRTIWITLVLLLMCVLVLSACDSGDTPPSNEVTNQTGSNNDGGNNEGDNSSTMCQHTSSDWITDKAATCKEAGSKHKECTACKEVLETASIDKLTTHTPGEAVTENYVDSDCETEGSYNIVVYCSVCEAKLSTEVKTIENKPHTSSDWITDKEATCKEAGSKHKECTKCEEVLETASIDKLTTHTPAEAVTENYVDSDCETEGSYNLVVYCSVCEAKLSTEAKTVEKKPHTPSDWITDKAATCKEAGSKHKECTKCEEVLETASIDKLTTHTPITDSQVAPTYTTRGKTEGSHCSLCNMVLIEQRDIATIWNGSVVQPNIIVQIDGIYYYEINSAEELAYLTTAPADWSEYNFVLKCDIWLNEEELNFNESGTILNTTSSLKSWNGFSCNRFLGNGHVIKGLYTSKGFIIECYDIKDLHLVNAYVRGNGDRTRGGICNSVGSAYYCSFDGVLYNPSYGGTPSNHYIGGIAGRINIPGGIVYGCTNYALIVNNCSWRVSIGGIVGDVAFNYEKIENCVNYGDIITNNRYCPYDNDGVSGIAARGYAVNCTNYGNIQGVYGVKGIGGSKSSGCINYGSISGSEHIYGVGGSATNCKNYGNITGTTYIGGIGATANKCENHGTVSGETYVGGIVGKATSPITNCINVGQVTGTEYVGAITGFFDIFDEDSYVSNCFYLKNDSINAEINGIGNLEDSAGVCEAKNEDFFKQE